MAESEQIALARIDDSQSKSIQRVQWLTVAWMSLELAVALFAAIRAHSVALAAFGADSGIELLSAVTVLWRFSSDRCRAEFTATKITAWLLVALAIYIGIASVFALIFRRKPEASYLGIILLVAAAFMMPWLGRKKRQLATASGSFALRADAAQSSVCAYLASIALAGLFLNAVAHVWWADAVAALCLIPLVLKEAKEAFEGHMCNCA
jgi:divalent metal cation (Fe/Co/Zn/Cd) transporter